MHRRAPSSPKRRPTPSSPHSVESASSRRFDWTYVIDYEHKHGSHKFLPSTSARQSPVLDAVEPDVRRRCAREVKTRTKRKENGSRRGGDPELPPLIPDDAIARIADPQQREVGHVGIANALSSVAGSSKDPVVGEQQSSGRSIFAILTPASDYQARRSKGCWWRSDEPPPPPAARAAAARC